MKTYLQTIYFFIAITEYVKIFCLFYRGQVEQALGGRFKEKRFCYNWETKEDFS